VDGAFLLLRRLRLRLRPWQSCELERGLSVPFFPCPSGSGPYLPPRLLLHSVLELRRQELEWRTEQAMPASGREMEWWMRPGGEATSPSPLQLSTSRRLLVAGLALLTGSLH